MSTKRTLGILGGMGPDATVQLLHLIIRQTAAKQDADHLPMVIYNLPQIPDRSTAILHNGPSPVPMMREAIQVLARTPAECILIPCNTIFYFYPEFAARSPLPIIHLIAVTAHEAAGRCAGGGKVGILATDGTRKMRLYEEFLRRAGCEILYPPPAHQRAVMAEIYGIKKGELRSAGCRAAAEALLRAGADVLILGCTELSLIYDALSSNFPVVDSLHVLARIGVALGMGTATASEYLQVNEASP